jgi:hypothetical protein
VQGKHRALPKSLTLQNMRFIIILLLTCLAEGILAQSTTTEKLQKKYDESLALFFYNNTLRMVNLDEDKEFDELIKDIEKMKFLVIKKDGFEGGDYQKLIKEYKAESFEEMMTSRHEGKNFDVYMKDGKTKGMIVTVNDDENLYVLDIVGSVPLNKITKFFTTIDESSDIGKRIRDFTSKHDH